jgi:hypothetical protein
LSSPLEGDVIGAPAATSLRVDADRARGLDPLARREREAVEPSLGPKPLEFERFEVRVVDLFPNAKEFNGVAVSQPPVEDSFVAKPLHHVGQRDVVVLHTAELCGQNPFHYLTELLLHARDAADRPRDWMPWNYQDTLSRSDVTASYR